MHELLVLNYPMPQFSRDHWLACHPLHFLAALKEVEKRVQEKNIYLLLDCRMQVMEFRGLSSPVALRRSNHLSNHSSGRSSDREGR